MVSPRDALRDTRGAMAGLVEAYARMGAAAASDVAGAATAKISIRVLKPINLRERLGEDATVEDGYQLVTSTMQRMLTRLSNERNLPVIG